MQLIDKQKQGKESHRKGMAAEAQAAQYLERDGYEIIAERYRNAYGEIDLIASKGAHIYFVEVKARKTLEDGLYALTQKQQQRLTQCALGFVAEHPNYQQNDMQFDLIAIAGWQLQHERNILHLE